MVMPPTQTSTKLVLKSLRTRKCQFIAFRSLDSSTGSLWMVQKLSQSANVFSRVRTTDTPTQLQIWETILRVQLELDPSFVQSRELPTASTFRIVSLTPLFTGCGIKMASVM